MRAALAVLLLAACGPFCSEQFERGVYIPSGGGFTALRNQNGVVYTMTGSERISANEVRHIALFHAVVVTPPVEVRGSGTNFKNDCLRGTEILSWKLGHYQRGPFNLPDRQVRLEFDGAAKQLRVGSQEFSTSASNVFIVQLDGTWQPTTAAVPLLISENLPAEELMSRVRAVLPNDGQIQNLRVYGE